MTPDGQGIKGPVPLPIVEYCELQDLDIASYASLEAQAAAVRRAQAFMEQNLGQPIDVVQIAAAACVSRFHLARLFRSATDAGVEVVTSAPVRTYMGFGLPSSAAPMSRVVKCTAIRIAPCPACWAFSASS